MMRIGIGISVIFLMVSCAQQKETYPLNNVDSFYSYFELGEYSVGFSDTVIFDSELRFEFLPDTNVSYEQYDYRGPTPMFIQIWHPLTDIPDGKPLALRDFRKRNLSKELESVYSPLLMKMDSFFINYNLTYEIENWDSIEYDNLGYFEVLENIKNYETKSFYDKLGGKKDFPVIVYHHGAQAASDDNFILFEYFASRGYIVVSSNFHLPFENRMYGYEGVVFDDTKLPKSVTKFAKSLVTDGNDIYFFGHSAGAQVGFKFLHDVEGIDGFVSLETTMEGNEVEYLLSDDGWPHLSRIIIENKNDYDFPILMIANTRENKPFNLFKDIAAPLIIQSSAKSIFEHDSYASGFHLRYMYRSKWAQPDSMLMRDQLKLFVESLQLVETFINESRTGNIQVSETLAEDYYVIQLKN